MRYLISRDVKYLACIPAYLRVHPLKLNLIQADQLLISHVLFGGDFVWDEYIISLKYSWAVNVLLAVFDQTHQKIESHLFGKLVDALSPVIHEVLEAINGQDTGLDWQEMEVA